MTYATARACQAKLPQLGASIHDRASQYGHGLGLDLWLGCHRRCRVGRRELEDSLRRLGVDHIDLYQVHYPDTGESLEYAGGGFGAVSPNATPLEEYWQVMADLKSRGEGADHRTVQSHTRPARGRRADRPRRRHPAPVLGDQPVRRHRDRLGARTRHRRDRLLPLQSGLLTGAFSAERVAALPAEDWRTAHYDFTTGLSANLQLAEALRPIATAITVSGAGSGPARHS